MPKVKIAGIASLLLGFILAFAEISTMFLATLEPPLTAANMPGLMATAMIPIVLMLFGIGLMVWPTEK